MISRCKLLLLIGLFLTVTIACEKKPSLAAMPDLGISPREMNAKLRLSAPEGWNTFKMDEVVGLDVEVISQDQVAFTRDFGARVFVLENGEWVEIQNNMNYPAGYIVLSPSNNDPFTSGAAAVSPVLADQSKPATVRIVLIGNIYLGGEITEDKTAAYIDVQLEP